MKLTYANTLYLTGLIYAASIPVSKAAVTLLQDNTLASNGQSDLRIIAPDGFSTSGGIDIGSVSTFAAVQLDYSGETKTFKLDMYQPAGVFEWWDGGGSINNGQPDPKLKMRLDGTNTLSLFGSSGAAISFSGSTGGIETISTAMAYRIRTTRTLMKSLIRKRTVIPPKFRRNCRTRPSFSQAMDIREW